VSKAKKMNSLTGPWGSKKEVSGAKKVVLEPVENGSESGGKWVSKQKKGLSSAPKGCFKCSQMVSPTVKIYT
jgi:hypothetical protein